jgi:hypothetical protein
MATYYKLTPEQYEKLNIMVRELSLTKKKDYSLVVKFRKNPPTKVTKMQADTIRQLYEEHCSPVLMDPDLIPCNDVHEEDQNRTNDRTNEDRDALVSVCKTARRRLKAIIQDLLEVT